MKSFLRSVFGAAVVALPLSALAGVTGTIGTQLAAVQSPVNYSNAPDIGVLGIAVTVSNVGGNAATNVMFVGTADNGASYLGAEGASCTAAGAEATCVLGQLKPGDVRSFTLLYRTPEQASGYASVRFTGVTYFAEGTGGPKSKPKNSTSTDEAVIVTLQAASGTSTASVVPSSNAIFTLYTVPGDGYSTRVDIPPLGAHAPASITEAVSTLGCDNFNTCYTSTITVPGSFTTAPYLSILLHQDKANIRNGTQLGAVQIWYDPDGDGPAAEVPVGWCASGPVPAPNQIPCIVDAVHYKNMVVPGWTPDLDGDMKWWMINTANGSYRLP